MLTVILTILRIIGVLLLALLILILLLVFSLLFVPVRYRALAVANDEQLKGELKASWFFHLLSLDLSWEAGGQKNAAEFRILGIPLERLHEFSERRHARTHASAKESEDEEEGSGNSSCKFRRFCDTIRKVPRRIQKTIRSIQKTLERPGQLAAWVEEYDAVEVIGNVWDELRYLLHHFRVRTGAGLLQFGTGNPAVTGVLTGAVYVLFPASLNGIRVEPEFTDLTLDTDLNIRGHIRAVHLLCTAWRLFRNQKLRRLIDAVQA